MKIAPTLRAALVAIAALAGLSTAARPTAAPLC